MVVLLCSHRHSITLIVPAEHLPAEPRPGGATNPLLPRLHRPDVPSLVAAHPWVALLGWATWLTGGGGRETPRRLRQDLPRHPKVRQARGWQGLGGSGRPAGLSSSSSHGKPPALGGGSPLTPSRRRLPSALAGPSKKKTGVWWVLCWFCCYFGLFFFKKKRLGGK